MGAIKYPVNACGMRDSLSGNMLALSRRNLVPLVLPPERKIASYAPVQTIYPWLKAALEPSLEEPGSEPSSLFMTLASIDM